MDLVPMPFELLASLVAEGDDVDDVAVREGVMATMTVTCCPWALVVVHAALEPTPVEGGGAVDDGGGRVVEGVVGGGALSVLLGAASDEALVDVGAGVDEVGVGVGGAAAVELSLADVDDPVACGFLCCTGAMLLPMGPRPLLAASALAAVKRRKSTRIRVM